MPLLLVWIIMFYYGERMLLSCYYRFFYISITATIIITDVTSNLPHPIDHEYIYIYHKLNKSVGIMFSNLSFTNRKTT